MTNEKLAPEMRKLIASVIIKVNMFSKEAYEDSLEHDLENYKIDLLRKIIHQDHQNPTDEAMITALNDYHREQFQRNVDHFKLRLMLVLYELKRDNLDKFNEFVQKYASLNQ